jgi:hypothetical protein
MNNFVNVDSSQPSPGDIVKISTQANGVVLASALDVSAAAVLKGCWIDAPTPGREGRINEGQKIEVNTLELCSVGDSLYLSNTPGKATKTAPSNSILLGVAQAVRSNGGASYKAVIDFDRNSVSATSIPLATTTTPGGISALPANLVSFGGATGPTSSTSFQWDDTGKIGTVGGALNVSGIITRKGTGTAASLSNLGLQSYDTVSTGTFQNNIQNISNGASASSDMICTADTGTDSLNYVDFGINSSAYTDANYTIGGALAGYLLSNGGDLTVGTATAAKVVKVHTGGTLAANLRATFSDIGLALLGILTTTDVARSVAASTVSPSVSANMAITKTWATGALASQADFIVSASTHAFVGASTETNSATFAISGPPIVGANCTQVNPLALHVRSGASLFSGAVNLTGTITKQGTGTPAVLANLGMQSYDTVSGGTFQNNIQNISNGASASSDMICTADTGTDTLNYVDVGINSSGYTDANYTIGGALAGYLLSNGGDLTVGTATASKVLKLHTGGTLAANLRATVSDTALTLATGVALTGAAAITSSGGGIGYATGAGGTGSQSSARTDTVVVNKLCGNITMFSAAQAVDATVTFTLTNSFIAATDFLLVQHISATNGGAWQFSPVCAGGSATITIRNVSDASITEATPLRFTVIKGVTA